MNGFEKHGIKHLSASSVNLWVNAPDVWVCSYLLKKRGTFGPAAERGKAVEQATVLALCGESLESAVKTAHASFDRRFLIGDEHTTKERNLIEPMTERAVAELEQYGVPEFPEGGDQEKISITANCGDFKVPVIGYLDLVYPSHGLVVDLKTTTRIPSRMSPEHQLQRAIYSRAKGNSAVKFLYVSGQKTSWLEDGDPAEIMPRLKTQIARMERFLAANDKDGAVATVPVNPNSFYWRGSESLRQEIYGL